MSPPGTATGWSQRAEPDILSGLRDAHVDHAANTSGLNGGHGLLLELFVNPRPQGIAGSKITPYRLFQSAETWLRVESGSNASVTSSDFGWAWEC